jgi:hypothetical protein
MVNCQLPESETLMGGELLELPPPHAASIRIPISRIAACSKDVARTPGRRGTINSRPAPPIAECFVATGLVNISIARFILKPEFETKLQSSWPMCIERMQERRSRYAIGAGAFKACRIRWTGVTTGDIVSTAARIIGIVNSKLRVIENVEGLGPEFQLASLPNFEMFQQRHVEVHPPWIIQEVPARISKGEPTRGHEHGRISNERAKALGVAAGRK